jgi:hypothetical protein
VLSHGHEITSQFCSIGDVTMSIPANLLVVFLLVTRYNRIGWITSMRSSFKRLASELRH